MAKGLDEAACARLATLKHVVVDWVRGDWPDLTNRQLALLIIICIEPGRHQVRILATRLGVPPPIISRVLDRLGDLGMVVRQTDRRDLRNVYAVPTERAEIFLAEISNGLPSN